MTTLVFLDQYAGIGGGQVVLLEVVQRAAGRGRCVALVPPGAFSTAVAGIGAQVRVQDWEPQVGPRAVRAVHRAAGRGQAVLVVNGLRALLPALLVKLLRSLRARPTHVVLLCHSTPATTARRALLRTGSGWCDTRVLVARCLAPAVRGPVVDVSLGVRPRDLPDEDVSRALQPSPSVKAMGRDDPVKGLDLVPLAVRHLRERGRCADATFQLAVAPALESAGSGPGAADPDLVRVGPRTMSWVEPDDILIVPSRSETACLTAQEAMARGAVVVASAVGDVPDFVRDGETGFLFPPGDVAALADAVERAAMLGPDARGALRRAAREVVEQRAGRWYDEVDALLADLVRDDRG